jgi:hypothetical protein
MSSESPCEATWAAIGGNYEHCKSPVPDYPASEVAHARAMIACPWYRGTGICNTGCYSEPACETDRPTEGWEVVAGMEAAA